MTPQNILDEYGLRSNNGAINLQISAGWKQSKNTNLQEFQY